VWLRLSAGLMGMALLGGCGAANPASPRAVAQEFVATFEHGDAAGNCRLWHTRYGDCVRSEKTSFARFQYRAGRDLRLRSVPIKPRKAPGISILTGDQIWTFTIEVRDLPATRFRRIPSGLLLRRYGGRWQEVPPSDG